MDTTKVRRTETYIPLRDLRHDVAVDEAHVATLKASIKARGQLSPVLVWAEGYHIIDGFHRVAALQALGNTDVALCNIIECDQGEFLDDRIISASTHKGVSFARVTEWVQDMFLRTKWAENIQASEAFRVGGKRAEHLNMTAFEKHWGRGLKGGELYEIVQWVKEKSAIWGLSPDQIANMLAISEQASPILVPMVRERHAAREGVLTRPMLAKIVQHIPDQTLQEAVAKKAIAEKLNEQETASLVRKVAFAEPEARPAMLTTTWLDQRAIDRERHYGVAMPPEEQERRGLQFQVNTIVALLNDLASRFQSLPTDLDNRDKGLANDLNHALMSLYTEVARWHGADVQQWEVMQKRSSLLEGENERLTEQIARMERTIGLGQKRFIEDTNA